MCGGSSSGWLSCTQTDLFCLFLFYININKKKLNQSMISCFMSCLMICMSYVITHVLSYVMFDDLSDAMYVVKANAMSDVVANVMSCVTKAEQVLLFLLQYNTEALILILQYCS